MGRSSTIAAALLGAALGLWAGGAHAACNLKTLEVPVKMEGLRPLVTAKINGEAVQLLLDSGAFYNSVGARFAAQQKLKAAQVKELGTRFTTAADTVISGVAEAETVSRIVVVPDFEFAGAKFKDVLFFTIPSIGSASGILGQNFLRQLDDEYDLANGTMRLVQPQDCAKVGLVYWAKPGMTYSEMPLESTDRINAHTMALITINGVTMRAFFDTGAETSFITARAAARAGVKIGDPSVKRAGLTRGLDLVDIKTWVAPFSSVKIGDEEIRNTMLTIGETKADDFDVLIGADFFLAHHVYVANSQRKLYFTYSGGPVFKTPEPEAAEASGDTRPAR